MLTKNVEQMLNKTEPYFSISALKLQCSVSDYIDLLAPFRFKSVLNDKP